MTYVLSSSQAGRQNIRVSKQATKQGVSMNEVESNVSLMCPPAQ